MNVEVRSANAFDPVRFRGRWFLPGTEPSAGIHGELAFEVSREGTLEIDGKIDEAGTCVPVLWGETSDGKKVTVFDAYVIREETSRHLDSETRSQFLAFVDFWVGDEWFADWHDVAFVEYSFGIHDIENWADRRCFSARPPSDPRYRTLVYESPEPILLFEDDSLRILLDSFSTGPSESVGQLESSIRHYPRIVIRSKRGPLPYYGGNESLFEKEWMAFILIALLMGVVTWEFGIEGVVRSLHWKDGDFSPEISVRHYFRRDWGKVDPLKHPSSSELLFPYETIADRFPELASRFSAVLRDNENPVALIYLVQCRDRTFYPSTLPELLFAFEELEKNLLGKLHEPWEVEEKRFARQLRKKLEPCCSKTEWDWVASQLTPRKVSFRERCKTAFESMKAVYPELGTDLVQKLCDYLVKTRNHYAHEVRLFSNDQFLYVRAIHWMAEFMTLMILRECGLPESTIKEVFFRKRGPEHGRTASFFDYLSLEDLPGRIK